MRSWSLCAGHSDHTQHAAETTRTVTVGSASGLADWHLARCRVAKHPLRLSKRVWQGALDINRLGGHGGVGVGNESSVAHDHSLGANDDAKAFIIADVHVDLGIFIHVGLTRLWSTLIVDAKLVGLAILAVLIRSRVWNASRLTFRNTLVLK